MAHPESCARVRMSRGKFNGINAIANQDGIIAALAMDQRGSLKKAMAQARGGDVSHEDLSTFKLHVVQTLSPYASAVLLDPEYALNAIHCRARDAGLLLAYEKSGYDTTVRGRLPEMLRAWSVKRLVEAGADAIKFLIHFDPDDDETINVSKCALVERIGAECWAYDVPFFLEVMTYDDHLGDEKGFEFARVKPHKVKASMQEFSKTDYGVDVLKVEFPVNMGFVEGMPQTHQVAYNREEAKQHFYEAASISSVPFIYLSAGVSMEVFLSAIELAIEAQTPFVGVLCGRAIWQDGIRAYVHGGAPALQNWLKSQGVDNIQALCQRLTIGARPWMDAYGGREAIEVVDTKAVAAGIVMNAK